MKVHFSRAAEAGLERIGDHIARDSPRRALSFVEEIRSAALELGEHPRAYPLASRYARLGIRRRVHRNYLILFRIDGDQVTVLLIVHGARDYGQLLDFPEV